MSIPYLNELVVSMVHSDNHFQQEWASPPGLAFDIWPVVKQCQNLQSFACGFGQFDLSALVGKPLTKVELGSEACQAYHIDDVAQLLNGASGGGVRNLILTPREDFFDNRFCLRYLCDRLNENSRERLRIVSLHLISIVFQDIVNLFPLIPSMLPNLEKLNLNILPYRRKLYPHVLYDQLYTNVVSFLSLCHAELFPRQIMVHALEVSDVDAFTSGLTIQCETAEINVEFGEVDANDNNSQLVLLTKGNATVKMTIFQKCSSNNT